MKPLEALAKEQLDAQARAIRAAEIDAMAAAAKARIRALCDGWRQIDAAKRGQVDAV